MGKFAVIDTETNWADQVMSIGTVIADADTFKPIEAKYQATREAVSELLEMLSPERIEKIENDRTLPHPDEMLVMAQKYKQPSLSSLEIQTEE